MSSSCCADREDEVSPKGSEGELSPLEKWFWLCRRPFPTYRAGTQPEDPSVDLVSAEHLPALQELVSARLTYL